MTGKQWASLNEEERDHLLFVMNRCGGMDIDHEGALALISDLRISAALNKHINNTFTWYGGKLSRQILDKMDNNK